MRRGAVQGPVPAVSAARRRVLVFVLLSGLVVLSVGIGLFHGGAALSRGEVVRSLLSPSEPSVAGVIMWKIRMPRIIFGLIVGAGLAACGSVFQGLLRNPLADPYTLGVSGGAALGATVGLAARLPSLSLTAASFLGAFASVSLVYVAASRKRFSRAAVVLAGIVFNFIFSALVYLILALSKAEDAHRAILWLMGDLSIADPAMLGLVSAVVIAGVLVMSVLGRELNVLTLGEEKASHLGLETEQAKKVFFLLGSAVTGTCVAACGIIGFVGLLVPHAVRPFTGPDHRLSIPASALAGGAFLVACDTAARSVMPPLEIPVGVITAIVGGAFFLWLLFSLKRWEVF